MMILSLSHLDRSSGNPLPFSNIILSFSRTKNNNHRVLDKVYFDVCVSLNNHQRKSFTDQPFDRTDLSIIYLPL